MVILTIVVLSFGESSKTGTYMFTSGFNTLYTLMKLFNFCTRCRTNQCLLSSCRIKDGAEAHHNHWSYQPIRTSLANI